MALKADLERQKADTEEEYLLLQRQQEKIGSEVKDREFKLRTEEGRDEELKREEELLAGELQGWVERNREAADKRHDAEMLLVASPEQLIMERDIAKEELALVQN